MKAFRMAALAMAMLCTVDALAQAPAGDPLPPPAPPPPAPSTDGIPPQIIQRTPPRYPEDAVCDKAGGTTVLVIAIGADGSTGDVVVEASSRNRSLDIAAIDAARQWQFSPELVDGEPVKSRVRVPVDFILPENYQRPHYCEVGVRVRTVGTLRRATSEGPFVANDQDLFQPDEAIRVRATYVRVSPHVQGPFTVVWNYLGGGVDPVVIRQENAELVAGRGELQFDVEARYAEGWKPGRYRVDIKLGEEVVGHREFVVMTREPA